LRLAQGQKKTETTEVVSVFWLMELCDQAQGVVTAVVGGYPPELPPLALPPKPPRDTVLEPLTAVPDLAVAPWGIVVAPPESFAPTAGMLRVVFEPELPNGRKYQP
jgi:hypothetical protein